MDNKEAVAYFRNNYPHSRVMISEAVDKAIIALEKEDVVANSLQQLKAEIALLANELDLAVKRGEFSTWSGVANKLRQLSAI